MNNDLISRQQLLDHLEEEEKMIQDDAERFGINKDVVEGMKQNIHAVMDYVEEADVAYDVENVIEQLKEQSMQSEKDMQLSDSCSEASYYAGMWQAYEKAIEIVKQEGVAVANNATTKNDDVCEWEYRHPFGDFPSCKNVNYSISRDSNWKYCPYCGKKDKGGEVDGDNE